VFENRVLRRVFGAKRDEVAGEWRSIHNEELYDLYCLPNIIRVSEQMKKNEMGWACGTHGGHERVLVWRSDGKRPLGRPRRRWEDNVKRDLQGVGWGGIDWIDLS
jgi:hypothetical protein